MPFCARCGAQNREGASFCESCGQPIGQAAPPPPQPGFQPVRQAATADGSGTAKIAILVGVALYAVAAVLLITQDPFGMALCLALAVGGYLAAYAPLAKGDVAAGANGAMIVGGVAIGLGIVNLVMGAPFNALWNFAGGAAFGGGYYLLKGKR